MEQNFRPNLCIICILALIMGCQAYYVLHLYKQEKRHYTLTTNAALRDAVNAFTIRSLDTARNGIKCNLPARTITYLRNGQLHSFRFPARTDLTTLLGRAKYDLRDPQQWTLKRLYATLCLRHDTLPTTESTLQLILTDSLGNVLGSYPQTIATLPATTPFTLRLGNLSADHLHATYTYPLPAFLRSAWQQLLTTLLLALLLLYHCTTLFRAYRNEKRQGIHREQYVNAIVHDLKRPLENQLYLCSKLIDEPRSECAALLPQSRRQIEKLLQSVNRLLLLSTDAHGLRLSPETVDLQAMLSTLATPAHWQTDDCRAFSITASCQTADPTITADPHFLQAALQNLVDNALKYAGTHPAVTITATDLPDKGVRITISDNGPGIPPDHLPHIYDRYYRGTHQKSHAIKGYGQGLYYSRLVIRAHGGTLRIDSSPQGTTATVTLPGQSKRQKR